MVAASGDAQVKAHRASTFADLGVCPELMDACDSLGWKQPTKIQDEAIPYALRGIIILSYSAIRSATHASCNLYVIEIGNS